MLAAALLNYADDEGYFNANLGLVRAACSPLREPSVSILDSLDKLAGVGYLEFGSTGDGKRYGRIVGFDEHQRVNRPTPSKIKDMQLVWESSLNTHGGLTEPSLPERKGKEGKGKEAPPAKRGKQPELTLTDWVLALPEAEEVISEDDVIYEWAEKQQIPRTWIALAWFAFEARYADKGKKYSNWRQVFRTAVKEDWLRLWRADPHGRGWNLTTAGEMAQREMQA